MGDGNHTFTKTEPQTGPAYAYTEWNSETVPAPGHKIRRSLIDQAY